MDRTLIADRGDAGLRLDLMVRRHLAGAEAPTRTEVQRWIERGRVTINNTPVRRVSTRTMAGDVVTIALPPSAERLVMAAEALPLDILYEDGDLLIVNKPPGLVVHPTYKHTTNTLMNGLLWLAREWPDGQRPSIVGRLDKQTSGLVVVARSAASHAALQKAMASRTSGKDYLAVVSGRLPDREITIDLRLSRDPDDRRRVVASSTRGLVSRTVVIRLAETQTGDGWLSLVRCRLMTGRMHQIRAHLSASGWPILGDAKYGGGRAFHRQALHAWRLSLADHPAREPLNVEAPIPSDMRALLDAHFAALP